MVSVLSLSIHSVHILFIVNTAQVAEAVTPLSLVMLEWFYCHGMVRQVASMENSPDSPENVKLQPKVLECYQWYPLGP